MCKVSICRAKLPINYSQKKHTNLEKYMQKSIPSFNMHVLNIHLCARHEYPLLGSRNYFWEAFRLRYLFKDPKCTTEKKSTRINTYMQDT